MHRAFHIPGDLQSKLTLVGGPFDRLALSLSLSLSIFLTHRCGWCSGGRARTANSSTQMPAPSNSPGGTPLKARQCNQVAA